MIINQKARAIALALLKVSVYVRRDEFRKSLEHLAFIILEAVPMENYEMGRRALSAAESLVLFGREIYEIEPINADILLKEIQGLTKEISYSGGSRSPEHVSLDEIFDNKETQKKERIRQKEKGSSHTAAISGDNTAIAAIERTNTIAKTIDAAKKDENQNMRQSAIIERIRQFGEKQVQLKDVIAAFPDVSERTIRYDLQGLCSNGIIEKIGPGGPGSYYKIRVI